MNLLGHTSLSVLALAVATPSLAVGPNFQRPRPAAVNPVTVQSTRPPDVDAPGPTGASSASIRPDWWRLLGSAELDDVIGQALAQNWTLASRTEALTLARARLAGVHGGDLPTVDFGTQIGREKVGATAFGPNAKTFPAFSSWGAGVTVGYDPDVFGGRRRTEEKANAQVEDEADELDAATLTLVSNVAICAIEIASFRHRIEVAEAIIASDRKTLDLVKLGEAAGAATRADVLQAQAQLDRHRTALPPLRQQLTVRNDALALLVGKSPADWQAPAFTMADFASPPAVPGTLPSELAHRRPDILAAEARLHAASAAIGVATADLYPRLDLRAAVSEQGLVGGPAGIAMSLLGGLAAPIFHGGSLHAAKRGAEAEYRARFADYQQIVLTALGQVADQMQALVNDGDSLVAQQNALESARLALELNRRGYAAGSTGLIQVLDAQRLFDQAEIEIDEDRARQSTDRVKLFMALGLHPDWTATTRGPDLKRLSAR